jgi:outer membrane protein assembly factor BamE (lipoprotein component of BamABCDE complex)
MRERPHREGRDRKGGGPRRRASRAGIALLAVAVLAVAGCSDAVRNHGYAPDAQALAEIAVGVDTRETVSDTLGPPSSAGVLRDSDFYYVAQSMERFGFREPQVLSRRVVAIRFDEAGVVRDVEQLDLADGEVVAFERRVTDAPTEGVGLLRQLGTNLGRLTPTSDDPLQ